MHLYPSESRRHHTATRLVRTRKGVAWSKTNKKTKKEPYHQDSKDAVDAVRLGKKNL